MGMGFARVVEAVVSSSRAPETDILVAGEVRHLRRVSACDCDFATELLELTRL